MPFDTHFRILHETLGGHVHMRVFAGKDVAHLGLCGKLVMREEEFRDFQQNMWAKVDFLEEEWSNE